MSTRHSHFGRLLREKRTEAGVTLGKVASALECSVSFVSDVEHGRRNPFNHEQMSKLAVLLQCRLEELMAAAAKDKQSVQIASDRDEVLEVASMFAHFATETDVEGINDLRAYMQRKMEERRGKK